MTNKENTNYTFLENFRYERKFRPETLSVQQVHNVILSSSAFFRRIYQPRYVNNLYLDTPELDNFHDNVRGSSERTKYRIRWYGEIKGKITGGIFEIKIKSAYRGTKKSFFLPDFTLDKDFTTKECHKLLKSAALPVEILDEIAGLEMKLLTRYNRYYFRDISGHFRLTTDSDISYYRIHDNFNRFVDFYTDKDVVVEIKYDEEYNEIAAEVINAIPFRMTKNSKYVDGIAKFFEVAL